MIGPDELPQARDKRSLLLNDLNRNGMPDHMERSMPDLDWEAVVGLLLHSRSIETAKGSAAAQNVGLLGQEELTAARDRQAEFIRTKGISDAQLERFDALPDAMRARLDAAVPREGAAGARTPQASGRWTVQRRDSVKGLYFDELTTPNAWQADKEFRKGPEFRVVDNVTRDIAADYVPHYAGHQSPEAGQKPVRWEAEYSKRSPFEAAIERSKPVQQLPGDSGQAGGMRLVEAYRAAREATPAVQAEAARSMPEIAKALAVEAAARAFAAEKLAPKSVGAFMDRTRANIEQDLAQGKVIAEVQPQRERESGPTR